MSNNFEMRRQRPVGTPDGRANRRGMYGLLGMALILASVDYFPNLPTALLDSSWMNGIGVALAQGAVPGRDVLFTYGPLAAMATGYWGHGYFLSLGLSLAIALNLALLLKDALGGRFLAAGAIVFLLMPSNEALFYLYVMALPLAVAGHLARPLDAADRSTRGAALLAAALLLPALTLAKLSFAPASVAVLLFGCVYAAWRRRWAAALLMPLASLASLLALWRLSGQQLHDLPVYLFDGEIITGYTGAMEWDLGVFVGGVALQGIESVLLYGAALLLLGSIARLPFDRSTRLYLAASLGAVLMVVIKVAVVRHGGVHSIFPWIVLAVLALYLFDRAAPVVRPRTIFVVALSALLILSPIYSGDGSGIHGVVLPAKRYALEHGVDWQAQKKSPAFWLHYAKDNPSRFLGSLPTPLGAMHEHIDNARGLRGAVATSGRSLTQAIDAANAAINVACDLEDADGSADIYPTEINCLIAKGIRWNPRPVFQSYSAYTPKLLQVNRQHLEGPAAPDHVYFNVGPIDERWPALEDGDSWTCLAANYRPGPKQHSGFVLLDRSATPQRCPVMRPVSTQAGVLGQPVRLGCDRQSVFASFGFDRNLAGRLSSLVYKQRRLVVDARLCSGELVTYRFVPAMAQTPFLLSPLVTTTAEFAHLFYGSAADPARQVESFTIRYGDSESPIRGWNPNFVMKTYSMPEATTAPQSP